MGQYFTNEDLPSNLKKYVMKIMGNNYTFCTDNGVFSKEHLDYGTELLISSLPKMEGKVLDVGTGYGPIGIFIAKNNDCIVDMIDVNKRAVHLTEMNIELNNIRNAKVFESDVYQNIKVKYNYIVTNPPIRAGKKKVYEILFEAKKHLLKNGELWFVIRKEQGAKSAIKDLSNEYNIEVVEKSKGFFIIKATSR